jgi:hypothetical protein
MRFAALAIALVFLAPAAQAQEFADWTTLSNGNTVLSGTLLDAPVMATGGPFHPATPLDGSSTQFSSASFSPPLARSDAPEMFGTDPPTTYTITFGTTVRDPILHLDTLASRLTFPVGTQITKRSGQPELTVSQNVVQGQFPDVAGTVQLTGDFDQISFSAFWTGGQPDGIDFQVGGVRVPVATPTPVPPVTATPVPTPTAVATPAPGVQVTATGQVLLKQPNGTFAALSGTSTIPLGATVDARKGTLDVVTPSGSAQLAAAIFTIRQRRGVAEAVIATPAGLEKACAPGRRPPPKGIVRTLKVAAKGLFRTVPKKGIVTGRNATWTTTDRCDGTLVAVQRGSVTYTLGRKAIRVKKGKRYLLKAKLFGAR